MYMIKAFDDRCKVTVVYIYEDAKLKDAKDRALSMMSDDYSDVSVSRVGEVCVSNNIYRVEGRNREFMKFFDE